MRPPFWLIKLEYETAECVFLHLFLSWRALGSGNLRDLNNKGVTCQRYLHRSIDSLCRDSSTKVINNNSLHFHRLLIMFALYSFMGDWTHQKWKEGVYMIKDDKRHKLIGNRCLMTNRDFLWWDQRQATNSGSCLV